MKVRISDPSLPQLNGDYPIDLDFTHGEAHLVKKYSKLRGLEIDDGIESGDTDLFLTLGIIGAIRAGRLPEPDADEAVKLLMKTKIGSVRLVPDEEDDAEDADPNPSAPSGPDETPSSSGGTTPPPADGNPGPQASETTGPETTPDATGIPT